MDQPVKFEPGASGEREPSWDLLSPRTTREILKQTSQQIGLYHPGLDSGEGPKSTATGCLLVFLSVIGLAVVGLTLLDLGVGVALLSSLVAFIPVSIYLSAFLWLDRFDPEPPATLAFAFLWGATISILVSAILNDFFYQFFRVKSSLLIVIANIFISRNNQLQEFPAQIIDDGLIQFFQSGRTIFSNDSLPNFCHFIDG